MKKETAKQRCEAIRKRALEDGDGFMYCYFAHEENEYVGATGGMDQGEALVVIHQMVKDFGIDSTILAAALKVKTH